ncbi:MAG: hypothetical protein J5886_05280, partial [Bacteroidales bacterium]|nr:hypothetical protein [Bacteroidales bacterium]
GNPAPGGTPFASLTPAPPVAIVVLAPRRLAVAGPLPLPLAGGGQVLQGLAPRHSQPTIRIMWGILRNGSMGICHIGCS